MTKAKYLIITILTFFTLFITSNVVNATAITYKTEFYSSIETAIYVNGLDNNLESGHKYYIYITQDNTTDADTVISKANMAKCDSLKYDSETNEFYLKVSSHNQGIFEKSGDYYAYIVKGQVTNKNSFSLIDGPTKLERPSLLANGKRISASFNQNGASYFINQYNYYTKTFGTNRKVNFYLGKIEDTTILTKLSDKTADAYDVLYSYVKDNNNYVYSNSFDTTSTATLDYNIWKDYTKLKPGEYYFVYYKLDDENGTYAKMDDVQAYTVNNLGILDKFLTYTAPVEDDKEENDSNKTPTVPDNSPSSSEQKEPTVNDKTIANGKLPNTGKEIGIFVVIISSVLLIGLFTYFKYNRLKDI